MIIGLDVGGTHTDVVLIGKQGLMRDFKVSTDANDLFRTVLAGLTEITRDIDSSEIRRAVLSTTLTTNAVVRSDVDPVGMIVSPGPGVSAEMFRTNEHYYVASGSIDHRGREVEPVNHLEIMDIAAKMKAAGIRNVGVVGKFSVRNPVQELAIRDILSRDFGKTFMGHRISGRLNFPRRIATTFLNTTVHQLHKKFYEAVRESLAEKGLRIPIHILKADGGAMNFSASVDFPAQTILSGPAASVMGAIGFAPASGECLVLDVGGTTTDMAILSDRVPLLDPLGITLGPYRTLIRALETRSIGIGGDSAVSVENGELRIGPDRKGPAMAFGGPHPTPTDAMTLLGLMPGGDAEAAAAGLRPVAEGLGLSLPDAAARIFDAACERILAEAQFMVDEINAKPVYTVHELKEGLQVTPREILMLGGPADAFAKCIGAKTDMKVRTVRRWKVANAIGAALARTTCEVSLIADTQQEMISAPEENYMEPIDRDFTEAQAQEKALDLLRQKALARGADPEDLEMEITEHQQFNMVRGFYTAGRNIRIKAQVKPGLIRGFERMP
ncbi:MAG: hydantoinase [Desulfobacterales bacterium]|nr:MAG: hydantoinase [Desulfobacterales bacterium]